MLGLTVISSFFDVGPTRLAWPSAKRRGDSDSIIDYIAMTSALKGYVSKPQSFPEIATSDHLPIQLTVLAPKRDRRLRKRLFEEMMPRNNPMRLPASWRPAQKQTLKQELSQNIPPDLTQLGEVSLAIAKKNTNWGGGGWKPSKGTLEGTARSGGPTNEKSISTSTTGTHATGTKS